MIHSSEETQFSFAIVYRAVDTFSNLKKARTVRPKSHDDVIYLNTYTRILIISNFFKLWYWCTYIMQMLSSMSLTSYPYETAKIENILQFNKYLLVFYMIKTYFYLNNYSIFLNFMLLSKQYKCYAIICFRLRLRMCSKFYNLIAF